MKKSVSMLGNTVRMLLIVLFFTWMILLAYSYPYAQKHGCFESRPGAAYQAYLHPITPHEPVEIDIEWLGPWCLHQELEDKNQQSAPKDWDLRIIEQQSKQEITYRAQNEHSFYERKERQGYGIGVFSIERSGTYSLELLPSAENAMDGESKSFEFAVGPETLVFGFRSLTASFSMIIISGGFLSFFMIVSLVFYKKWRKTQCSEWTSD